MIAVNELLPNCRLPDHAKNATHAGMSRDTKIVGLWRDKQQPQDASAREDDSQHSGQAEPPIDVSAIDESPYIAAEEGIEAPSSLSLLIRAGAAALAAAWLGFYTWLLFGAGLPTPGLTDTPSIITTAAIPLALIGIIYLILMRNSRTEMRRFGDVANLLRAESHALELRLAAMREQLSAARAELQQQAQQLQEFGFAAAARLQESADSLAGNMQIAEEKARGLQQAGLAVTASLETLNAVLPQAREKVAAVADQMAASGAAALEQATLLEVEIEAIALLTDRAKRETLSATQVLSGQLLQLEEASRAVTGEIDDITRLASERIDTALERARDAVDTSRKGLDAQAGALGLMIDQSRAALTTISADTVANFTDNISAIEAKLHEIDALLDRQNGLADQLTGGLDKGLASVAEQFATLEQEGGERNQRLNSAMDTLAKEAERLQQALSSGHDTADRLIGRSESLLLALDSSTRELDETLPLALGRLDERLGMTLQIIANTSPEAEKLEAVTEAILGRVNEAEEMIRAQATLLREWLSSAESHIVTNRIEVEKLGGAIAAADEQSERLAEQSGPKLIGALLRVKETAEQAAERARQSLARTIPEAADALGKASEKALDDAVSQKVVTQMEQISVVAQNALSAAHQATERLMRQMMTIADTSASVERRIDEARNESEERDRDSFARRVAVLIEALNSTAIDVSKILSNEVADSSWAAYLKGDRGVFTRRAVKLLDAGEAREISHHYDQDAEFREHVNRYIHDFEAMLRHILATRDGSALAVTLLSSDMGKLYVALAQAIERLRN